MLIIVYVVVRVPYETPVVKTIVKQKYGKSVGVSSHLLDGDIRRHYSALTCTRQHTSTSRHFLITESCQQLLPTGRQRLRVSEGLRNSGSDVQKSVV